MGRRKKCDAYAWTDRQVWFITNLCKVNAKGVDMTTVQRKWTRDTFEKMRRKCENAMQRMKSSFNPEALATSFLTDPRNVDIIKDLDLDEFLARKFDDSVRYR